jgi:hypothetical protein
VWKTRAEATHRAVKQVLQHRPRVISGQFTANILLHERIRSGKVDVEATPDDLIQFLLKPTDIQFVSPEEHFVKVGLCDNSSGQSGDHVVNIVEVAGESSCHFDVWLREGEKYLCYKK